MVGASQEDVRVKDGFADWRVARLERMVPELVRAGAPSHWVVGTMLYFECMSMARVAGASRCPGLSRRTRMKMLVISLCVIDSFHLHSETRKNAVTCFVALLCVLKHGHVAYPHMCATLPLEHFSASCAPPRIPTS